MALLRHLTSVSTFVDAVNPLQFSSRGLCAPIKVLPLKIEAARGKKRVPRTESPKVLNLRSRKRLTGTPHRPRLLVSCSERHLYAQVIDDVNKTTLISACTAQKSVAPVETGSFCPILESATKLGEEVALECLKQGITRVLYYRLGTLHWKRVKTFRLAAQASGLEFEYPE